MNVYKYSILVVVIIILVSMGVLVKTTTTSNFYCGICHFKEKSLVKTSFAHNIKNSTCVGCHDESSFSISKHFSSNPEFINKKCEGCHEKVKSEKEIKGKKIIKMNHFAHMDGKKTNMKCLECHSNVAHDISNYSTNRPSMVGCFTGECHVKEKDLKKCDYCHYVKFVYPEK
ncbi:MAG: hypothetical protein N2999_04795 [Proteobacteria bacterium]|nr:hypothetical protein [Pseudomonadota bacterium]